MKKSLTTNISKWYVILLILVSGFLVAAISPSEQPGYATLKIYKKSYTNARFGIRINDQMVIKHLRNRTWFEVKVPAGKLTLETVPVFRYPSCEGKSFSLEVEEGKVYYLEALIDYEFWVSTMYLVLREKEQANAAINRFKQEINALHKVE